MANPEHVAILEQGVEAWNRWRMRHLDITRPDLSNAYLSYSDLRGTDLRRTNLRGVHLRYSDLRGVDLDSADLTDANLNRSDLSYVNFNSANLNGIDMSGANLIGADLSGTELSMAKLIYINLSCANLSNTNLSYANLNDANLRGANLRGAYLVGTVLGNIDLRNIIGLETVRHGGPSTIGTNTLECSQGDIPEAFLRGVGLSDTFIEYARTLVQKTIDYYTCFLSYSNTDEAFAKRLYSDLQSEGVRCWFAPHDLRIGDRFADRIEESIRTYDKLLIVLSENSVKSAWVEDECRAALEKENRFRKEQQLDKTVLFPIKLDEALEDAASQWVGKIRRERHIGDFSNWKNHDDYQKALRRLLRDLKAGA